MTPPDEPYADLLDSGCDPELAPVIADLDRMRRIATAAHVAPARDAAIRQALHDRALERFQDTRKAGRPGLRRRLHGRSTGTRSMGLPVLRRRFRGLRLRLAAVVAALLLALGSVVGYPLLSGPVPVSAQAVLRRAVAAMRLAPHQAAHLTYRVAVTMPRGSAIVAIGLLRGTRIVRYIHVSTAHFIADVWVLAEAGGAPSASAQTLTTPEMQRRHLLIDRYIQVGSQVYGYNPGNNEIALRGTHDERPGWLIPTGALDGVSVTRALSLLALHAPQQVRLLPQRTLDGAAMAVIEVNGWSDAPGLRTTFYFDAHSFLLRGIDAGSRDPAYPTASWQVRLSRYTTMAAAAVPPRTFTLNAASDARVAPPLLDPTAFASAFTTVCHRPFAVAQLQRLRQSRRQSLLAACRATAPATSRADLVAAMIAPYRAALAGAVAAGQITPAQERAALAAQQRWLTAFVTTPGGISSRS